MNSMMKDNASLMISLAEAFGRGFDSHHLHRAQWPVAVRQYILLWRNPAMLYWGCLVLTACRRTKEKMQPIKGNLVSMFKPQVRLAA